MKHNWTYKKLGEVANIYQPKTLSTEMLIADGKYLVYGANGVIGRYSEYNHEEKELLVTCRGATCGTLNVSVPFSWINGNAMVVHISDNQVLFDFLKYVLKGLDWSLIITGAAQPQITRQNLAPTRIPIPSLDEQKSIVQELDGINHLIDLQEEQLREYDRLAQSLFYTTFGDPATNPKGWEVKELWEIATVKIGPFGSLLHTSDYINGGVPLVNPIHMKNGYITADDNFTVSEPKAEELSSYRMSSGDFIFARRGDIGRCAIVTDKEDGFLCGTGSLFVRFDDSVVPIYALFWTKCESFIEELTSQAKGATMLNINCDIVEHLRIPVPPLSLQQSFAVQIEAIEQQKALIRRSLDDTRTLLAARMQYYFE